MNLSPNNQVPIADEPPLAQEPPSHPPPHRASSSQHSSSPRPTPLTSSFDCLGARERDVAYMKEQMKIKKTINKMFQYLSVISKSYRRDDVAAPPSPSPPPNSD
ncbi:hypothetical protein MRB53_030114 [Persea americana]|uniref:Uncharacterized protein n=1 Tax=Persea americana TaxID=3435 RepID=A0ACC2KKD0_PERAE|nr:hypothetical protein MRB53_030114 [Persea americana]